MSAGRTKDCPCCDGTGEHIVNRSYSQDPINAEAVPCDECNSTGQVSA